MFILDRIDRELPSLERLELKFGLSSEFFNKIPVRILLDVLFRVFRFFKASFYALASSFMSFWNFVVIMIEKLIFIKGCLKIRKLWNFERIITVNYLVIFKSCFFFSNQTLKGLFHNNSYNIINEMLLN